jgi:hypothetical protein
MWSDEEIHTLLDANRRNQQIFERITREMASTGFCKISAQSKDELRKLKDKCRKLKK